MKYLFLLLILFGCSAIGYGQCTTQAGFVCIAQSDNDRIVKDLNELKALKTAYASLLAERSLTDAERASAANVIKIAQDTISILQQGIADRDKVIELQQKALHLYADLVQRLTDQINKPKSSFSKFMDALRTIGYIATGIFIGRAIP